ncbi:MAG: hypothetical protein ACUVTD_08890 [Nitrososphaerales archaeon]
MPYRYDIYIGSNNRTRKIGEAYRKKVVRWANSTFPDGYTVFRAKGYYNGFNEDSLLVSVLTEHEIELSNYVSELKRKLRQNEILLAKYEVDVLRI